MFCHFMSKCSHRKTLNILIVYVTIISEQSCYRVADLYSCGMEVMHMKNFDFKDLMAFGTFLIAFLTLILAIIIAVCK